MRQIPAIMVNSARLIVARFGTARAMAKIIDVSESTISGWLGAGHIPPKYWQHIIDSAARHGIIITPYDFVAHLRPANIRNVA